MVEIPLQLNKTIRKEVEIVKRMVRFEIQGLQVKIGEDEEEGICVITYSLKTKMKKK